MQTNKKFLLIIFTILFFISAFFVSQNRNITQTILLPKKIDTNVIEKREVRQLKIPNDTTIVMNFKNLSYIYNYSIIDIYTFNKTSTYPDTLYRIIKIFNKNDSLIQIIYPRMLICPWYYNNSQFTHCLARSFITNKNLNCEKIDNYRGEIVVADLNFDGFEDFAIPVGSGVDNGPHYAFYIFENSKFIYNYKMSNSVLWFPDIINDSSMTFTTIVACCTNSLLYRTYKYDTINYNWKLIENYLIDH